MQVLSPRSDKNSITVPIIDKMMYWITSSEIPNKNCDSIYIFTDQSHVYVPFNKDFGPLHLGEVYKFTTKIQQAIQICKKSNTVICIYTGTNPEKQANAAFLVGAYSIICQNKNAEEAWEPFKNLSIDFKPFRDSTSEYVCSYKCTILDCLRGLYFAYKIKWFDFSNFSAVEYEKNSAKGWGDFNEIIPQKMIAFSTPIAQQPKGVLGKIYTPIDYISTFKSMDINLVVRLNESKYDEQIFINNGIGHLDMEFPDGSAPNQQNIDKFLNISENTKGAVAVHCKSGLGRTGTLIGMYAMKHYHIKAADFIGWVRIVRPGSIHGPQHQCLLDYERKMHAAGQKSIIWQQIKSKVEDIYKMEQEKNSTYEQIQQQQFLNQSQLKARQEKEEIETPTTIQKNVNRQNKANSIDRFSNDSTFNQSSLQKTPQRSTQIQSEMSSSKHELSNRNFSNKQNQASQSGHKHQEQTLNLHNLSQQKQLSDYSPLINTGSYNSKHVHHNHNHSHHLHNQNQQNHNHHHHQKNHHVHQKTEENIFNHTRQHSNINELQQKINQYTNQTNKQQISDSNLNDIQRNYLYYYRQNQNVRQRTNINENIESNSYQIENQYIQRLNTNSFYQSEENQINSLTSKFKHSLAFSNIPK